MLSLKNWRENMANHKCADCGFLAQHIFRGSIPQGFIDVEQNPRETGALPGLPFSFGFIYSHGQQDLSPEKMDGDKFPTCFTRAFNLEKEVETLHFEMQKTDKAASYTIAVRNVIAQDRTCEKWVKWKRGFTPKEHQEMLDREWEIKRQDTKDKEIRDWQERQERRHSREENSRYIFLAIVTILITLIASGKL
jgi:hypothetical protein